MKRTLAALVLLLGPALLRADPWPQWRGPQRDGHSAETVTPWSGPPAVLWKHPVGEGHSAPVVASGKIFVHARVPGKDAEEVIAYDTAGKELWRTASERGPFQSQFGNGPRATPVVDGDRIYTLGVTGLLGCREVATGKILWEKDLLKTFSAANLTFGVSSSPVMAGNLLLVMVGGPKASVVAFDKTTGDVKWQEGGDKATYASPLVVKHQGQDLALFLTHDGVTALDPATGKRFWQFPLVDLLAESSTTPVVVGDTLFASSVTFGSVGLKLTRKDDRPAYEPLWKDGKLTCYFSTPVAVGDYLYAVTGQIISPSANLHCVEAKTGKVRWTHAKVGKYHASVMAAGDKLLMLEEGGDLVLIDPDPKEYKELCRAKVCGHSWVHPALSDGRLYVRDDQGLQCLQLGARAAQTPADLKGRIDALVQPLLEKNKIVGATVGVVGKDGARVFGFGKVKADGDQAPAGDTVYEIGSVTKVFTSLLLADMVEGKQVQLDEPVAKLLPATVQVPAKDDKAITLLHLATHTSGLPRVPAAILTKPFANPYADFGPDQLYEALGKITLATAPGAKHAYSNLGAGLLGHALSLRAGKSYEGLIRERIAGPLGMSDTCLTLSDAQKARLAPGHKADLSPAGNWDFDALAGAGAIRSTANDMVKFLEAQLGKRPSRLDKAIAATQEFRCETGRPNLTIGLGWLRLSKPDGKQTMHWHNGGTGGYVSFCGFSKERGTGVVVLINTATPITEGVADKLGTEVLKLLDAQ